jgi:regulator of sigma D
LPRDLQGTDEKSFDQILKVHPGILKNYQESINFRKEYETPIETGFSLFYDQF